MKFIKILFSFICFSSGVLAEVQGTQNNIEPSAPAVKSPKQPKVYNLDFEDELVEGGVQKPDLFYLMARKNHSYKKLVRLRENFLPEMKETSEHLLEVGGSD
jgi:hypothetical protein